MSKLGTILAGIDAPNIETDKFAELIDSFMGDANDALEILTDWLGEVPDLIDKFQSSFAAMDQHGMKGSAHSAKSLANSVGAMEMGRMAESFQNKADERAVTEDDTEDAETFINLSRTVIEEVKRIHQHLQTLV